MTTFVVIFTLQTWRVPVLKKPLDPGALRQLQVNLNLSFHSQKLWPNNSLDTSPEVNCVNHSNLDFVLTTVMKQHSPRLAARLWRKFHLCPGSSGPECSISQCWSKNLSILTTMLTTLVWYSNGLNCIDLTDYNLCWWWSSSIMLYCHHFLCYVEW